MEGFHERRSLTDCCPLNRDGWYFGLRRHNSALAARWTVQGQQESPARRKSGVVPPQSLSPDGQFMEWRAIPFQTTMKGST
jgi:hypothetical protein